MSKEGDFTVTWVDGGRPPQVRPNPDFPNGRDIDASNVDKPRCTVELPYMTHKNIGHWLIECRNCGLTMIVTAASRTDDPKSVTTNCLEMTLQ